MAIYCPEQEIHFPKLSVGDTLKFAALARTPRNRFPGVTRDQHAIHVRDVVMASFGLLHTMNTFVGNDFIRGVSGGERKRVSIAEVMLAGATVQAWDNSTRGLDSATALEFCRSLKIDAEIGGSSVFVSLYQASQDAYDIFDKVTVLYLGRQIYFGPAKDARKFFEDMGYVCIDRQTTGDFLTSVTSPLERVVKPGFENKVPRTPDEFEAYWKNSREYALLLEEIDEFNRLHPIGGGVSEQFRRFKDARSSSTTGSKSPYYLSYPMQVKMLIRRGFVRLKNDYDMALATIIGNTIAALLISSIFYNQQKNTSSFQPRSTSLFFSVLFNSLSSMLELFVLYALRPIVEKHNKYAFYRPSAEALSSLIVDMPTKICAALAFNMVLYFMVNLRREAGAFFIFFLFSFFSSVIATAIFRLIASVTKTVEQAFTPASLAMFLMLTTTGFIIPIVDMHPFIRWVHYLNPMAYSFESLMINEFRNLDFTCNNIVPAGSGYNNLPELFKVCNVVSAVPGENFVQGSDFLEQAFSYYPSHLWRNFGITWVFAIGFYTLYFIGTETIKGQRSKGEILVFPYGYKGIKKLSNSNGADIEGQRHNVIGSIDSPTTQVQDETRIQRQEGIFQWQDVCYDIKIKGEPKRILDHVSGWVKPGTLTALMGASGAGKTSLLDTLADRVSTGVVTGDMFVNGSVRDLSFQRKTGYAQQQDVHLSTSTVRESLEFSALLRQPNSVPKEEKLAYVNEVISILEMEEYADAVVGVPGEGLNVEQRKRLTIGVELAAKPELLLFLDEPTSGLDSQTAWSIMMLMKKLTNNGQAILCTIHQPSAVLFQQFDRLLFLKSGGQTVYYGDIGANAQKLIKYFESHGAPACPPDANPAEWMLHVIGAAPGSHTDTDWFEIWKGSKEYAELQVEMAAMIEDSKIKYAAEENSDPRSKSSFAIPLWKQMGIVSKRALKNNWRDPLYIWSKILFLTITPFFLGILFWKADNTLEGMTNQMYAIFMILVLFSPLMQQLMPPFATQRTMYETREAPSRTYSWVVFILSMFVSEAPWQALASIITYFTFYYPAGLYRNAVHSNSVHERGALFFLMLLMFFEYTLTFSYMVLAALPGADTAANIGNVLFNISLGMAGVLASKEAMPGFWIFMYRISPFTYIVGTLMSTGIADSPVVCAPKEILHFPVIPTTANNCGDYLGPYAESTGGFIYNPDATSDCQYCSIANTNTYLESYNIFPHDSWRNFGFMFIYIIFNILACLFFYWLARVPKKTKNKKTVD